MDLVQRWCQGLRGARPLDLPGPRRAAAAAGRRRRPVRAGARPDRGHARAGVCPARALEPRPRPRPAPGRGQHAAAARWSTSQLPGQVADAIARHGLSAHQLVVEITEDGLLTDLDAARRVTSELREAGVSLALDDFGTGYSSLAHLHEIPLTTLKVDRAFVVGLNEDPRVERFMRAVLRLGRGPSARRRGRGRRDRASRPRRCAGWAAGSAQGYYFARPAPASDLTSFMARPRPAHRPELSRSVFTGRRVNHPARRPGSRSR